MRNPFEVFALKEDKTHVKVTSLQNPDLVLLPPHRRTWDLWGFAAYWLMHNMALSSFTSAATILSYGLSVPYAMAVVLIGNAMTAVHTILNGQPGGDHHISFTSYTRILFGSKGFYLGIFIRASLSVVWYASQAWLGGLMLNTLLSALSHHYLTLENTFPDSVPFTSKELIGFCLFQLGIIPFIIKMPHQVKGYMAISAAFGYMAIIGICVASVVDNGGNGPLMSAHSNTVHGSAFSWTFVKSLSQWYGSSCSGTLNKPDFTRFSKHKYSQVPGTIIGKMLLATFVPFMGIVSASASKGRWGTTIWKPNQLMDTWMEHNYSPGVRAGCFFAALALTNIQLVFNSVGNCWAFSMDFAGVMPRYMNIRRGTALACVLIWVIQPWTMYNTSTNFGTVMTGFSVFISPLIGVIICDYWIIRRRKLKLSDLYTDSPDGIYYFYKGYNVQGLVTFFVALAPGLPGLISSANPSIKLNNEGIMHYYYGNTLFGWFIGFFLYWALCTIWKPKGLGEMDEGDYYGTYWPEECEYWGVLRQDQIDKKTLSKYVSVDELETETSATNSETEEIDGASVEKQPVISVKESKV